MKNKIHNIVLFITLTFCSIAFANDPDGAGGGINNTDEPVNGPIDSNLILLVVAGAVFCYYQFHKNLKTEH